MIFQRALRRELAGTAGAVFATLLTITITVMLIKILGQAAGGKVASADVVALIGFQALNYLPVILILTGFIAVLLVVTRSYQDSEMVVWFASGLSLTRWIRPVLAFGMPIVVLTAALSFALTPWANRESAEYRERFAKREDIARVSPGRFQESSGADRIFFVESVANDASMVKNIFVSTSHEGRNGIIVAREGKVEVDKNGDKFVIMQKGRRYEGTPGQADYQIMEFERYGALVSHQQPTLTGDTSARSLPTPALLAHPTPFNLGELLWRLSLPLMAVALMLLAIPLSFVNPRAGRSIGLLVSVLVFVTYSNLVSFFQATVSQQRLPFALAWWPVHLAIALVIAGFFLWRLQVNSRWHPTVIWCRIRRRVLPGGTERA